MSALAPRTDETDLTTHFLENPDIGPKAFVMMANPSGEYPEPIRRMLRRETTKQIGALIE